MKTTGFCLFEYDENEETILSFVFPEAETDLKTVVTETAALMISYNCMSVFSCYKNQYLYLEGKINPNKSNGVRLYGICLMSPQLHPPMYSAFAEVLCQVWADRRNAAKVLRSYLAAQTDGQLSYEDYEFSDDAFDDDFMRHASFEVLLDRAVQHIPVIWQALACGRSVAVYAPDPAIVQACAIPILSLVSPGKRNLLPLVIENSTYQTEAADEVKNPIWCSCDPAVLTGRFDLAIDLAARTVRLSPTFAKEAGKSGLLETLSESIADATANEGSIVDVMEQFNQQILDTLEEVRNRVGELTPTSIAGVNLPSDTKLVLTAIAANGVFEI